MVELEADDALASAVALAAADERVHKVCIWTPDKDLAQCVQSDRVVQIDRRANEIRDAEAVRRKYGVEPARIPDFLALVGDTADGYPGIPGIGRKTAASMVERYGAIEDFPPQALGDAQEAALLFKRLATLVSDAPLYDDVEALRWRGPRAGFERWAERLADARLLTRAREASRKP
jgi:5'-3' exonuclease